MNRKINKKKNQRGNATSSVAMKDTPKNTAPSPALILRKIGEGRQGTALDDLIGVFGLSQLRQQEALAQQMVRLVKAGAIRMDRRGRYHVRPQPDAERAAVSRRRSGDKKPVGATGIPNEPKNRHAGRAGGAPDAGDLISGRVVAHREGYGFLMPRAERSPDDVFLAPHQMKRLMHGDLAKVRVIATDAHGRREGVVAEVLERPRTTIVGRLHVERGSAVLLPSDPRTQALQISPGDLNGATAGQMVVVEMLTSPTASKMPTGRVVEVLGSHLEAGMEVETAIRAYHLPYQWPKEVVEQSQLLHERISAAQMSGRKDLRRLPLVTIDGADARDFDDALCAKPVRSPRGGWKLWVAIADVSTYVQPGTPLDAEAQRRGTSVYFPGRVLPMLPEALSNGLCSLKPGVDRLCMVCEMRIDRTGEILSSSFYPGIMRSHARLVYEEVAAMLDQVSGGALDVKYHALMQPLRWLNEVFDALYQARVRRGAIDFESTETEIIFDQGRKIAAIVPVVRTRAHRIVEECMVAANVEAAKYVARHKYPALYRVHAPPDPIKIAQLRVFLSGRGIHLGGGATPSAADFANALLKLAGRVDAGVIQTMILRSLMQARYSPANEGHFGLGLEYYAHFTSPIRRYPDLLLHRAIKSPTKKNRRQEFRYSQEEMERLGEFCSMAERRADEASRDVDAWLKCEYMSHRVGDEFEGLVTGVASFGLFIELVELYVAGMVHVSQLGRDYFEYDPKHQRLAGSRSGRVYTLGEKVRVQVTRVSLDERKIDLQLVLDSRTARHSDHRKDKSVGSKAGRTKSRRSHSKSDSKRDRRTGHDPHRL